MNRVNPLHMGMFFVVLITFLFFQLSSVKTELEEAKSSFETSEKLAVDLSSLKSAYADKKKIKKSLEKILANRTLRAVNLKIKRNKKSIRISAKSIDARVLNTLMGKVLNGSFNIVILKVKTLSETKASLEMEIKW